MVGKKFRNINKKRIVYKYFNRRIENKYFNKKNNKLSRKNKNIIYYYAYLKSEKNKKNFYKFPIYKENKIFNFYRFKNYPFLKNNIKTSNKLEINNSIEYFYNNLIIGKEIYKNINLNIEEDKNKVVQINRSESWEFLSEDSIKKFICNT